MIHSQFLLRKLVKKFSFLTRQNSSFKKWLDEKGPYPPPKLVKQYIIRRLATSTGISILVETGSYKGEMIYAQFPFFDQIFSIELSENLFNDCLKKFKDYPNVFLYQGDSGDVLFQIIPLLKESSMFWLDAHYSAGITARGEIDCPIEKELEAIGKSRFEHIIVIDDVKDFNGEDGYPTIDGLKQIVKKVLPNHQFENVGGFFFLIPVGLNSPFFEKLKIKLNFNNE